MPHHRSPATALRAAIGRRPRARVALLALLAVMEPVLAVDSPTNGPTGTPTAGPPDGPAGTPTGTPSVRPADGDARQSGAGPIAVRANRIRDLEDHGVLMIEHVQVSGAGFGPDRIRERRSGGRLRAPERQRGAFAVRTGIDYAYTHVDYQGLATRNRDLHRLMVPIEWRIRDAHWDGEVTPVVATSSNVFKDLPGRGGRHDLDLYARLAFQRMQTAGRGWRIALHRDAAFGTPRFYPSAAWLWRRAAWGADFGVPASRAWWHPTPTWSLVAAIHPEGGRWHVVSDERGGADFDYVARGWRASLTAAWLPWPGLRLELDAGLAFRRRHWLEDDTGARIARDAGTAPYWGLRAVIRL